MNLRERLRLAGRVFFDTAPVIYFVEENARYLPLMVDVFTAVEAGEITAVTSPITLVECLIAPYQEGNARLRETYIEIVVNAPNTAFIAIDSEIGIAAAEFRAQLNLGVADALQVAAAVQSGCTAFLTNDKTLKRIADIEVLVLDEMLDL